MNQSFEDLKNSISISANLELSNSNGWMSCYCPICGKSDRKTGGFKLDHDNIAYNCFRASCEASCAYDVGQPISRKFRSLMDSIGVQIPIELKVVKSSFQKALGSINEDLYVKNVYDQMKVPDHFIYHTDVSSHKMSKWEDYLFDRCCSLDDVFYIDHGDYKGKVAVACHFFDRLIGFQIINPDSKVKYITESINENLIFINQRRLRNPVIVVEGLLDAKCFPNAVGNLSYSITKEKAYHLRGRDVILLPDKIGGSKFIEVARTYGWKVSLPDWSVKDLNAAVVKYGVIEAAKMIDDAIIDPDGFNLDLMFKLWRDD